MNACYTLVVYYEKEDGHRVRDVVDSNLRMPFHWADKKAAELNGRYGPERTYAVVNAREFVAAP